MSNETRGLARHDRVLAAVVGDQSFDRPCLTPLVGPCARSGEAEFSRGVGPRAVHPGADGGARCMGLDRAGSVGAFRHRSHPRRGAPLPEPWPGCGLHRHRLRAADYAGWVGRTAGEVCDGGPARRAGCPHRYAAADQAVSPLPEAKDLFGHACRMSHRAATQCSYRSDFLSDFRCMRAATIWLSTLPPVPAYPLVKALLMATGGQVRGGDYAGRD
jgi:hypothetical protein